MLPKRNELHQVKIVEHEAMKAQKTANSPVHVDVLELGLFRWSRPINRASDLGVYGFCRCLQFEG